MSTIVSGTRPPAYTAEVSPILPLLTGSKNFCRIGDSITCGRVQESHVTWANTLNTNIAGGGLPSTTVAWVGTQVSADPGDTANEGYGGTGIVATNSRVAQYTTLAIDVAIVMLGMNDAAAGADLDLNYYMQYFLNAHALRAACRFLWLGPTRSTETDREAALARARARMSACAGRLRSYGVPIIFVDLGSVLPADGSMNADGLHPTVAGHQAMGAAIWTPFQRVIGQ